MAPVDSTGIRGRTYVLVMPGDQSVSEQRPERCPRGHVYVDSTGSFVKVVWEPCLCTAGHTGHRTYWCERCGHVLEVPPCQRGQRGTSETLGVARPNWQFRQHLD